MKKFVLAQAGPTTLATGLACPLDIVVDGDSIYWSNAGTWSTAGSDYNFDGAIMRLTSDGTGLKTLVPGQSDAR